MAEVTRRAFLGTGSTAAATGLALAAAPGLAAAAPAAAGGASGTSGPAPTPTPSGTFVVHVRDARTGDLSVMTGESEVLVHDPALVARVVSAASER
jgi:hypothetical protein